MKFIKKEKIEAIYLFHRIILVSCKNFTQLLNSNIKIQKKVKKINIHNFKNVDNPF